MEFKIRKYWNTTEDWNVVTLIQIIPVINIGEINSLSESKRQYNIAVGWLCWIAEWSWLKQTEHQN